MFSWEKEEETEINKPWIRPALSYMSLGLWGHLYELSTQSAKEKISRESGCQRAQAETRRRHSQYKPLHGPLWWFSSVSPLAPAGCLYHDAVGRFLAVKVPVML